MADQQNNNTTNGEIPQIIPKSKIQEKVSGEGRISGDIVSLVGEINKSENKKQKENITDFSKSIIDSISKIESIKKPKGLSEDGKSIVNAINASIIPPKGLSEDSKSIVDAINSTKIEAPKGLSEDSKSIVDAINSTKVEIPKGLSEDGKILSKTIQDSAVMTTAAIAATSGSGKGLGNLQSLMKADWTALIGGKFQNFFSKENKEATKQEKEEKPKATPSGGGSAEIKNIVDTVTNLVTKFAEIKDKSKDAQKAVKDIGKTDFGKDMLMFLKQFDSPDFDAFLFNPDQAKFEEKRASLQAKINSETDLEKRARYLKMAENVKNPYTDAPAARAKEVISGLVGVFDSFSSMDDISISAISKFKSIATLNIADPVKKFLTQFQDPTFSAFTTETDDWSKISIAYSMEKAELASARKSLTGEALYNAESSIYEKYKYDKQAKGNSPSMSAVASIEGIISIFESMSELKSVGFGSYLRLKFINRLNVGKELSKLIKNISSNLEEAQTPDFTASLSSLSSVTTSIDTFSAGFTKSIFKIVKVTALKPNFWMKKLFSSMNFDIPGNIEKEYGKMDESSKGRAINEQISALEASNDPQKKEKIAALREELSKTVTQSPGTMFSRLISEKLAGLKTVMTSMGGVKEKASVAVKSVMFAIPLVKIATSGMKLVVRMMFSLIKDIDKVLDSAYPKRGILSKIFGKDIPKSEKELSNKEKMAQSTSKVGQIVGLINSLGGIYVGELKKAAVGMWVAVKLGFHQNFPLIAAAVVYSIKQFKNIDEKNAEKFSTVIKKVFEGISVGMKSLSKAGISSILAKKAMDAFQIITVKVDELNEKYGKKEMGKDGIFKGIKTIIDSVKGIGKTIIELAAVTIFIPIAMVGLSFIVGTIALLSKLGKDKDTQKGTHNIFSIANGIIGFILKMAFAGVLFTTLSPLIMVGIGFVWLTIKIFQHLASRHQEKELNSGIKQLAKLSLGIAFFALVISAASLLINSMLPKILIGIGVIVATIAVFGLLGKFEKYIRKGAEGMLLISVGIAFFALGMFLLTKAFTSPTSILYAVAGIALMIGTAIVFSLIGERISDIAKGTIGIIAMSIGIAFFGIAIGILSNTLAQNKVDFESIAIMTLLIGGMAVVFGVIGFGATQILLGSAAVGAMSLALGIFGMSFQSIMKAGFDKLDSRGWDGLFNIAKIIGMFGLEFALIGAPWALPFILMGSGAVGLMGVALTSVVSGLKSAMTIDWNKVPIDSMKSVIVGLGEAFGAVGQEGSKGTGIFGKALNLIGIGPNNVKKGIEAVLNASEALRQVASGVRAFDALTKELNLSTTWDETNKVYIPAKDSVPHKIATVLGVVNKVFSDIGASGNTNNSVIGMIFGSDFKKSDTEVGINSVLNAGKALMSVGSGIRAFDQLTKDLNLETDGKKDGVAIPKIGSVPHKITTVLGIVNKVFSDIGASGNTNNSVIGLIFGSDFKKSDTEVGINSVMNAGKALAGIAKGILEFDNFTKNLNFDAASDKGSASNGSAPQSIQGKITTVLTMINSVFASIGSSANSGLIGMLGFDIGKSDVEKGIDSVRGVGKEFSEIAQGLKLWGDLDKQKIDLPKISENVKTVLTMIGTVFAKIGQQNSGEGWFSDGDVTKGVKAVSGIGKEFTSIAEGLKHYADLQKQGIDVNKLSVNITQILTAISSVFSGIGSGNIVDFDGKPLAKLDEASIKKGIESVSGAGTELEHISKSLKGFSDLKKSGIDMKSIGGNIKSILIAVSQAFMEIGSTSGTKPITLGDGTSNQSQYYGTDAVKKGVEAVKGLGAELSSIAGGLRPFMDLQKEKISIPKLGTNIKEILTVISKVFEEIGKSSGESVDSKGGETFTGTAAIAKGIKSVEGVGGVLKGIADMLRPFMDMQKSEKGQKPINIKTIKKNIAEMVSLTADMFGALGGDMGAQGRIKTETGVAVGTLNAELIEGIMPVIKKAQEGLSMITAVSDLSNKIDPNKWKKIKDIVPAMAMMPVDILTNIAHVYETMQGTEVNDLIDNVIPKLVTRITDIVDSQNKLANSMKGSDTKSSPLYKVGDDMKKFLLDISKPPSNVTLDRVDRTVKFVERFAAAAPNFKLFQDTYSKHVKDVKFFIDSVNKIQNVQFDRYIKLQEIVKDMITASNTQVKNNVSAIVQLLGQETQFLDKIQTIVNAEQAQQLQNNTITQTQEEFLNKLHNTPIQNLTQIELLQIIANNSAETLSKLNSQLRVKVN